MGGSRFTTAVPETFATVDGRMVAAVNGQDGARAGRGCAIAHAASRETLPGWAMIGGSVVGSNVHPQMSPRPPLVRSCEPRGSNGRCDIRRSVATRDAMNWAVVTGMAQAHTAASDVERAADAKQLGSA